MQKNVVKFGGSNLKNIAGIKQIIQVIKQYQNNLIIVVSAFYGITDQLLQLTKKTPVNSEILNIFQVYIDTLRAYKAENSDTQKYFEKQEQKLRFYLETFHNSPTIDISIKNQILSLGEQLSAYTLHRILNHLQIPIQLKTPEEISLITAGNLSTAIIHPKIDYAKIAAHFQANKNYIVPGFYGISKDGKIALFGRGGSDYTAAILAYATKAISLDLWKDVSGFMSADPKLIPQSQQIRQLSYLEAAELSYFGAKIIHPGTIRPLEKKKIPLLINNINKPDERTKIFDHTTVSSQILKSITYNNNLVLLRLKGSGVGIKKGILKEITEAFDRNQINIRSVITSQIEIDFLLHQNDLKKALQISKQLQNRYYDISIEKNISLIACIGNGIKSASGIAGKLFGALAQTQINIKHIVFGASDVAIYLIIDQKDLKTAIKSIHQTFFNPKETTPKI